MIKKSAKFENDMLKIKEDMVQDILWFHTTGSFFFAGGGMLRCGPKIWWNRAWKVSVTQRGFRKVVAEDFTDESDSSLWNLTSLLVAGALSSLVFCLILLVKNWKNPLKGLYVMCLSYVENFGKCQPLFIRERVDLFSFMAMNSSYSTQINTAKFKSTKTKPKPKPSIHPNVQFVHKKPSYTGLPYSS